MAQQKKPSGLLRAFLTNHWGGAIFVFGFIHLVVGGYMVALTELPKKFGVETTGSIVEKKAVKVSRKSVAYRIIYRFEDRNGRIHEGETPVGQTFFRNSHDGDEIKAAYLSFMPSVHYIEGGASSGIGTLILLSGIGITLVSLFLLMLEHRKVRDGDEDNLLGIAKSS
ncbi:MAG TPA: hypothetical protein ENJ37_09710 [Deltaproteobacteria bacterium]|nr:hypothetical protein [Deltaproteobacteria bacterium]